MLMTLPDDNTLYDALLARDAAYDGAVFVGVTSTGIFCRLTCPARKPKRENCIFYSDVAACIHAGFRPCKRCHPVSAAADNDATVTALLSALDADPARRWSETDIAALGHDPSTVRRSFKRHFGMTFLDMARQRRLANGFTALGQGKVIEAQLEAGFDSPSAFRNAFARMLGASPHRFQGDAMLRAAHIPTPLGDMIAVCDNRALHLLEFTDRKALSAELSRLRKMTKGDIGVGRYATTDQVESELAAFFEGRCSDFQVPLVLHGTPFTKQVWTALRNTPAGTTRSYAQLAQAIGAPNATRAVARANGANQIALIIPCHRVIGADGSLTGYGGGLWRKQRLITLERSYANKDA